MRDKSNQAKREGFKMLQRSDFLSTLITAVAMVLVSPSALAADSKNLNWTLEDVLASDARPFAIGHRGYGINLGDFPDEPIENSLPAVRRAYREGIRIVEVDVQLTGDGRAVVYHDDFLPDFTCLNALNYGQIRRRLPQAPLLQHVLQRTFVEAHNSQDVSGQLIIEMKSPSPLCDPGDVTGPDLVKAVVTAVEKVGLEEQVILESFSPALLLDALAIAPQLPRALTVSLLQFLTPEQVEAATGFPVTPIDKDVGLGLQWAEIGPVFRLPGYMAFEQYVGIAIAVDARAAAVDVLLLAQAEEAAPGSAATLVNSLKFFNLSVWGWTIDDGPGWDFLESIGLDGIFTDDIALGLDSQAY
jgi:glycerophosphoryl diester phosphodiesterase